MLKFLYILFSFCCFFIICKYTNYVCNLKIKNVKALLKKQAPTYFPIPPHTNILRFFHILIHSWKTRVDNKNIWTAKKSTQVKKWDEVGWSWCLRSVLKLGFLRCASYSMSFSLKNAHFIELFVTGFGIVTALLQHCYTHVTF